MIKLKKILIANRGEIACRIARTAKRLGIGTVAVFSDADANAQHVAMCDEAVNIGPAAPRESYLRGDAIVEAALRAGADAIHPGYGFLSENAAFAAQCARSGLIFVGPPPAAIQAMGSKSSAKALMERAGVPLTPGYHGDRQDADFLCEQARAIGFPVLIKASAGGGGKGMRRVERAEDFAVALTSCKREAAASFGDDHVLVEKYVLSPRHIEVQVFADGQGNCVYLFERDCSVQRRHQKVIEEAPAPGMTPERRQQMGEAAVAAALAVGYEGAGTVEFIAAPDGTFYFMEMNTRLQVEHPVTEMITGQDLVEWQLRVAMGERLPLLQHELAIRGHAFEARIYAEDPARDFLPSIGRLQYLQPPQESANVRVDTGVIQGDLITPHYDPMIAKLIVWDETRERALWRLSTALKRYFIVGVANNVEFLQRIATSPAFSAGDVDTALIEREREHLFPAPQDQPALVWLVAAVAIDLQAEQLSRSKEVPQCERYSPWHQRTGWRLGVPAAIDLTLQLEGVKKSIRITHQGETRLLQCGAHSSTLRSWQVHDGRMRLSIDGMSVDATIYQDAARCHLFLDGAHRVFTVDDPREFSGEVTAHAGGLRSPMPGKVIALQVKVGDKLAKGAAMLVLEAMKMEHTITAPFDGTVTAVNYGVGEQVVEGAELMEFEPAKLPA